MENHAKAFPATGGGSIVRMSCARELWLNGPGKVTKKLQIDKKFNTLRATEKNKLWFEDRGVKISGKEILKTPRIGVHYAGKVWSRKPYRFVLKSCIEKKKSH